jgi:hypothetical protein
MISGIANEATIITRIQTFSDVYNCTNPHILCHTPWIASSNATSIFPVDVENMTIGLQHAYYSFKFPWFEGSSLESTGSILDYNGNAYHPSIPSYAMTISQGVDIIRVGAILEAAGTDLNRAVSSKDKLAGSVRKNGGLIVCLIDYSNANSQITYTYRFKYIPDSQFKFDDSIKPQSSFTNTRLRMRFGALKVVFKVGGRVTIASFQILLISLTSSIGLLAVANLVVEWFMLSCTKDADLHAKAKYEQTIDFSDFHDEQSNKEQSRTVEMIRNSAKVMTRSLIEGKGEETYANMDHHSS